MRIAIDARWIGTSTGRYIERLLYYLAQIDHDNEYLVLLNRQGYGNWQPPGPNFSKILAEQPVYSFAEQFGLARQLYQLKADLVHFTAPQHPILYFKPFVVTIHDLTLLDFPANWQTNPLKRIYSRFFKPLAFRLPLANAALRAKAIIVPSNYVRAELAKRFHVQSARIHVTYEAADRLADKPEPTPELKDKKFLLYVGNGLPHKNLTRLLAAFKQLQPKHPDLHLVLVGNFYGQLKTIAQKLELTHVHFLGFVTDAQLAWLYASASVYVFPSLSEGFGLPGLEAMACGVPVAAAAATSLPEIYEKGATYFDPLNEADIAAALERAFSDSGLRQQLVKDGQIQVKKYAWSKMAAQTLAVYEQALKN